MDNANSREYLEKIKTQVIENLKRTAFAPSVQMTDVPRDAEGMDDEADAILDDLDEDENKDTRYTKRRWDKYVEKDGELSESEDEDEAERNGVRKRGGPPKRRNLMDYRNVNAPTDFDSGAGTPEPNDAQAEGGAATADVEATQAEASADAVNPSKSASMTPAPQEESSANLSHNASPRPAPTDQDGDVDMNAAPATAQQTAPSDAPVPSTQVTTPPLSPTTALEGSAVGAPPTPPSQPAAATTQDEEMDEGDALEHSALAQEEGLAEREEEDVAAEEAAEKAKES